MILFSCLATQTKRASQKPNLQVNTHHGIGAWECTGLCLIELLPERQGAFSRGLPVLYFGRSLFPAPSASPSPHPQIHLHHCWEGAQFTQIGNAVIGVLLTSASFLSLFDHSNNDSLFSLSLLSENKKKLLKDSRNFSFLMDRYGKRNSYSKMFFHFCFPPPPSSARQSTLMETLTLRTGFPPKVL